ncbi:MAG: MBOAT family protein [Magnetococcales bacterium]|nr:MBOAT family protein [Magnetococcales bacterium]
MVFNSFEFIVFYVGFYLVFFGLNNRLHQLYLVIVASLFFYGYWNPVYVLLLLTVCLVAFWAQEARPGKLVRYIGASLAMLFFFKYTDFFILQVNRLGLNWPLLHLVLPVGISFYVFHAISLMVDQQRQRVPRVSLAKIVAYIAFFPLLIAGPIVRARTYIPQLEKIHIFRREMFRTGMVLFFIGLFKKVVVADNVGLFVDAVYAAGDSSSTAGNHWLAFYFYAVQIYYDFSGYSDMAIGLSRTLGYRFPANFRRPYFSATLTEFWQRWHISLSSWLRDYLYIALGGNRKGHVRTLVNLATVMLLGGLWHGASWTFVVWGALHGVVLGWERIWARLALPFRWPRLLTTLLTFHFVCFAWVLFRSPDFEATMRFLQGLSDWESLGVITSKFLAVRCLFLVVLAGMIEYFSTPRVFWRVCHRAWLGPVALVYLFLMQLFGNFTATPFIYFQF